MAKTHRPNPTKALRGARHQGPDITIVGVGLAGVLHLTREASAAIATARCVCFSRYHRSIPEVVRELNPRARLLDLDTVTYEMGQYRPSMYRRMAEAIVEQAAATPGLILLEPGSATLMDMVTQAVSELAAGRGLSVKVIPGIRHSGSSSTASGSSLPWPPSSFSPDTTIRCGGLVFRSP
jgi:precorrin-3B methylase